MALTVRLLLLNRYALHLLGLLGALPLRDDVLRDVVFPEATNLLELVIIFEVEFFAHLCLEVSETLVLIAVLADNRIKLPFAECFILREDAAFEVDLLPLEGLHDLQLVALVRLPLASRFLVGERVQRLLVLLVEGF